MKKLLIAATIASTLMAGSAMAYDHHGVYLNGMIGTQPLADTMTNMFSSKSKFTPLYNANLGYQFNKYFALEAGYSYFGWSNTYAGIVSNKYNYSMPDLTTKLILPIGNRFNIYAKLGVTYLIGSETISETYESIDSTFPCRYEPWKS